MANRDAEFEPQLVGTGNRDADVRSHYLRDMNRDVARAGRCHSASTSRDRYDAFRTRRVVIKTRLIKLAGRGLNAARAHLRYLQRDGVTREGLPGDPYDATNDRADGASFLNRCDGDRHQFRFIVSPDYAIDYPDLKDFTRRLMRQTEHDLDTKLDWIAVDQYNSGHPHGHIVLNGKDDRGKDLVIARDYLSQGMKDRAEDRHPGSWTSDRSSGRNAAPGPGGTGAFRQFGSRPLCEPGADGIVRSGTTTGDAFPQTLRAVVFRSCGAGS